MIIFVLYNIRPGYKIMFCVAVVGPQLSTVVQAMLQPRADGKLGVLASGLSAADVLRLGRHHGHVRS